MDRPALHCFVAFPMIADVFTDPVRCELDTADELRRLGYLVVGPDPHDEMELATYERLRRHPQKRRWLDGSS